MNKLLEVYDNIVPISTQNFIEDFIHNTNHFKHEGPFPLYYVKTITDSDKEMFEPGFSHEFLSSNEHSIDFCGGLLSPLFTLSSYLKFNVKSIIQARVFLQTPSGKSIVQKPHVDLKFPHWVCLYYVNDGNGDTVFYNDSKNEIKRVSPKKGRIVFFDGTILHSGSSPSSNTRTVVNIGFTIAEN